MPKGDPKYKHIITAQNVYTGYLFAAPMPGTAAQGPEGSAARFRQFVDASAANGQGPPKTITTDGSLAEWKGEFEVMLRGLGIIHRIKEPTDMNAMGKLDATQQRLRALLRPKGGRQRDGALVGAVAGGCSDLQRGAGSRGILRQSPGGGPWPHARGGE